MSGLNHNQNHFVHRIETRVLAPPGGFSSFSLGHSHAEAAPRRNSRVQEAPGGNSSFSIGSYTDAVPQRRNSRAQAAPGGNSSLSLTHVYEDVSSKRASSRDVNYNSYKENIPTVSTSRVPAVPSRTIPGLENHYAARGYQQEDEEEEEEAERAYAAYTKQREPQTDTARMPLDTARMPLAAAQVSNKPLNSASRVLTTAEYAAELRLQISEKKRRDSSDVFDRTGNELSARKGLTKDDVYRLAKMEAHSKQQMMMPGASAQALSTGRRGYASSATRSSWTIAYN